MPPLLGSQWHSLLTKHARIWKAAVKEASQAIEARLSGTPYKPTQLIPVLVRSGPRPHLHHIARIRQSQSRWSSRLSQSVRRFTSSVSRQPSVSHVRTAYLKTAVGGAISRSSGHAPFASTMRPNMTGGTLGRTAGGYTLGSGRIGGARHFSHGPASPAHVVQNVSQGLRAFLISGHKAQFDGVSQTSGEKKYKAISTLQHESVKQMRTLPRATPGTHIVFAVNPTITVMTNLQIVPGFTPEKDGIHLNSEGLLDYLSADFSRALNDLSVIMSDLRRLSALGDLPITYHKNELRVHLPGCDAETVEVLCNELGVQRGTAIQDPDLDAFVGAEMALLFPFAPSTATTSATAFSANVRPKDEIDWQNMLSDSCSDSCSDSGLYSTQSSISDLQPAGSELSLPEAWSDANRVESRPSDDSPLEYHGLEGIYRFIQQCDAVSLPVRH